MNAPWRQVLRQALYDALSAPPFLGMVLWMVMALGLLCMRQLEVR